VIIFKAVPRHAPATGHSGAVILTADEGLRLFVAAGTGGMVEVLELQTAGKRRMAASDFLRGHKPLAGDWLGPEMP
jgi:methionyl-tRNA formyltransferase